MSAFKGTPGPWFAGKQCDVSGWVEIRVPGYSRNPVAAATPAAAGDAEARRDAETLANARLISAAPELLEALRGILNEYERLHALFDLGDCQATVDARAAIEKATGGAA